MDYGLLKEASDYVMALWPDARPTHGLILGSGWSEVVSSFVIKDEIPYHDIPGLGKTGVVGHAGKLSWATGAGLDTFIFQGRRHYYEGVGWTPIAIPPFMLKTVGARSVLLTNAAGGVRKDMHCGDLMILTDHINNFGVHPLVGEHNPVWGPRFVDQTAVYNRALIALLRKAGANAKVPLLEGVYLASTGPTYETPAEVRAFARWGADAVGMSTVPEAILAHAAGLRVAGLSCITNLAAGISPAPLTHEEVTETTRQTMPLMKKVLTQFWEEMARAENA